MELKLASSIAWDTWRLDHLRAIETGMYALGHTDPANDVDCDDAQLHTAMTGAITFEKQSPKFSLMSIYEQRLNRSIHKNLATLRGLKAERESQYQKDLAVEVSIARANDINGLSYKAPCRPSQNGLVFSTDEILATANRETIVQGARSTMCVAPIKIQFAGAWDNFDPNRPNSGLRVAAAA
jgi:hypothetical protein